MVLTVKEALELEILHEARLVAGHSGLGREITWVSILEVLDEIQLLRAGELLVTTAFGLKEDLELQERLIPALAQKGLAALAIQTGFYIQDVPEVLRVQADAYALPLIVLPQDLPFTGLTQAVLQRIIGRQMELLQYSERMHHEFTQVILENRSFSDIAQALGQLISRSVRIEDPSGTVLAEYPLPAAAQIRDTVIPVAVGDRVYGYISILKNREDLNLQKTRGESGRESVRERLQADSPQAPELTAMDEMALRQAATVTALEMLKKQAVTEAENRIRGDFLEDMLNGNFPSGEALEHRAQRLGWDPARAFALIVLRFDSRLDEKALSGQQQTLLKLIPSVFFRRGCRPIAKIRGETIVVFWQQPPGEAPLVNSADFPWPELHITLSSLQQEALRALAGVTLSVGTGGFYLGLNTVPQAYREALSALDVSRTLGRRNVISFYQELGVYRLLLSASAEAQMSFYRETLAPLINQSARGHAALVLSLETFLNSQGNIRQAAAELGIHRQTLRHRLHKIEGLTGLTLANPEDRLKLQLGLILKNILSDS